MSFFAALAWIWGVIWPAVRLFTVMVGGYFLKFGRWMAASKSGLLIVMISFMAASFALQVLAWRWCKAELLHLQAMRFGDSTSVIAGTITTFLTQIFGVLGGLNHFLPLTEMLALAGVALSIETGLFAAVLVRAIGQSLFNIIPGRQGASRSALEWIKWYFGLEAGKEDVWFIF